MSGLLRLLSSLFTKEPDLMPVTEAHAVLQEPATPTEKPKPEEKPENACFHRRGKITSLGDGYGMIDGNYQFQQATDQFKVGMEVNYLAYDLNGKIKVSKILSPINCEWDAAEQKNSFWFKKSMVSQVIKRDGRTIVLSPDIVCDLNTVQSEFVPIEGDWLSLEALVEADKQALDFTGAVLEVQKILPVTPKLTEGVVKIWNNDTQVGQINADTFFNGDSLAPGYMPCYNDKVIVESIESQQGRCIRRALKVIPNSANKKSHYALKPDSTRHLVKDKNGITITAVIDLQLKKLYDNCPFEIEVKNTSRSTHKLIKAEFQSKLSQSQLRVYQPKNFPINIDANQTLVFKMSCLGRYMGTTQEMFIFSFVGFEIGRWITIKIIPEPQDNLRTAGSRAQKSIIKIASESMMAKDKNILIGQKPIKPPSFISNKLPVYEVPEKLVESVFAEMNRHRCLTDIPIERIAPCLKDNLNYINYENRFHTLLYLEEIALQINMHKYDIKCTIFIPNHDFMMLEVMDLSERKPSVIIGDRVIATRLDAAYRQQYEGFVHKISNKHVYIKFHTSFHALYAGEDYTVEFHFSRSSFRRYHQAISLAIRNLGEKYLFPSRMVSQDAQLIFQCEDDDLPNGSQENKILPRPLSRQRSFIRLLKEKKPDNKQNTSEEDKSSSSTYSDIVTTTTPTALDKLRAMKAKANKLNKSVSPKTDLDIKTESNHSMKLKSMKQQCNLYRSKSMQSLASIGKDDETKENKPHLHKRKKTVGFLDNVTSYKDDEIKKIIRTCPFKLRWYNKNLNNYQKDAVKNILKGEARSLPYIIFGPPGTGKTITLIESALQLYKMMPHSRLLITAPSNSAADLLTMRLVQSGAFKEGELLRLVAFRCVDDHNIPMEIRRYCSTADIAKEGSQEERGNRENGVIVGQKASMLGRHRITVGTCMIVGSFYTMGFKKGHFTHIFVDEAGQATEPETMIPLALLDPKSCQVILAGDPRQLGPCVFSLLSSTYGLSESYLERLINRFPYTRDSIGFPESGGYDPRLVTKLVLSYRSLPDILALPNLLFYNSELKSMVCPNTSDESRILKKLTGLLSDKKPPPAVVFHGVRGENFQMADSPSWFNSAEAMQVFHYINALYDKGISPTDIGVISPYVKQCQQIRGLMNEAGLIQPKIGSVEEFQGQEFKIVIVSTVRSNENSARKDSKLELGFIASPRRVNVAISRAQALLIIIGNPHLLHTDSTWRSVLKYAVDIGGYVGCDLPRL